MVWLGLIFLPESLLQHFHSGFTFEEGSSRMRLQQYMVALEMFPKHWLVGLGLGNQSGVLIGKQVGFDLLESGLHCLPFSILLETGILGFASFVWLIITSFIVLFASYNKTKDTFLKGTFLAGLFVLAGYLTHNLFHNFMYLSILGLIAGIINAAFHNWKGECGE